MSPRGRRGRIRLYSRADIERIRQVQRLIDELGVNLAGAEIIIKMSNRLRALEVENEPLRNARSSASGTRACRRSGRTTMTECPYD